MAVAKDTTWSGQLSDHMSTARMYYCLFQQIVSVGCTVNFMQELHCTRFPSLKTNGSYGYNGLIAVLAGRLAIIHLFPMNLALIWVTEVAVTVLDIKPVNAIFWNVSSNMILDGCQACWIGLSMVNMDDLSS